MESRLPRSSQDVGREKRLNPPISPKPRDWHDRHYRGTPDFRGCVSTSLVRVSRLWDGTKADRAASHAVSSSIEEPFLVPWTQLGSKAIAFDAPERSTPGPAERSGWPGLGTRSFVPVALLAVPGLS